MNDQDFLYKAIMEVRHNVKKLEKDLLSHMQGDWAKPVSYSDYVKQQRNPIFGDVFVHKATGKEYLLYALHNEMDDASIVHQTILIKPVGDSK